MAYSHDTFKNVPGALDATEFENRFIKWMDGIVTKIDKEVIAIDRKTMRGATRNKGKKKSIG